MIKSLDGLRAVAIILVVLDHAGLHLEGKIGVELFFVISGFLITKNLHEEVELSGRVSFRNFYIRRFARLYPSLLLAVVVTILFLLILGRFDSNVLQHGIYMLTFTTDLWIWLGAKELSHFFNYSWSLGVEEQFYLVWPICFILIHRINFSRKIIAFYSTFGLLSLSAFWTFFHSGPGHDVDGLYFGPVSHLGALACGSLIAFPETSNFFVKRSLRFPKSTSFIGVLSLMGLLYVSHYPSPVPFNFDPSSLIFATILSFILVGIFANFRSTFLVKIFELNLPVMIGRLSYTLYLFNIIFFQAVEAVTGKKLAYFNALQLAGILVFLVITCQLIYFYYESPLRKRINRYQVAS
jgi:peptidoglycan/LPS O-acetylase OafA/YrhL